MALQTGDCDMPKTGEIVFMYVNNGVWNTTDTPNYWRDLGYFVMECYVVSATVTHTAW
jgi:hypothetical protein